MEVALLQLGGGLLESVGQAAAIAAMGLLLLMLLALAGYAFRYLRGGGIEWPTDEQEGDADGVVRGNDDDEWDFY